MLDLINKFRQRLGGIKAKYKKEEPVEAPKRQLQEGETVTYFDGDKPSGMSMYNPYKKEPNVSVVDLPQSNSSNVSVVDLPQNNKKVEVIPKPVAQKPVKETKPAVLTVYHPDEAQTDSTPNMGGFLTKMEFGDVAIGNRNEYWEAHGKYVGKPDTEKVDTFIRIPELSKIVTPYGEGIFRVRDTLNIRYDGDNKIDVFMPHKGYEWEQLVRETPSASYSYL